MSDERSGSEKSRGNVHAKRVADLMGAVFAVVFILALCAVIGAGALRLAQWILAI